MDFNFYTLEVLYYKTSKGPNSKNAKKILSLVETQRNTIKRLVLVAQPNFLTFSLYLVVSNISSDIGVTLKPIVQPDWTRVNGWRVGSSAV